jgi:hypothetical protein
MPYLSPAARGRYKRRHYQGLGHPDRDADTTAPDPARTQP